MKIFLISYGDFDYDGRLRELMKVFAQLGELSAFTRGSMPISAKHTIYTGSGYAGFIMQAIQCAKKEAQIDVLVLDNRKAVIPGLVVRVLIRPKAMVQDCRELYVSRDVHHLAGKIGCFFEKLCIQRADVVICANQERAQFMKGMYRLQDTPLVYENLRKLEYSDEQAEIAQAEKFAPLIRADEFRIIATDGCSVSRTNDVLVRQMKNVHAKCRLLLVGNSTLADRQVIESIIAEQQMDNVEILGQLNQNELKYLISQSHIGIVSYHQKDLNNKFCASGKIFEFLYEGIPVVTSTNPPLTRLCEENGIGAADDNYTSGICRVISNYAEYRHKVATFAQMHTVEQNNAALATELKKRLQMRYES